MNSRHITREEWIQFYTTSQPSRGNHSLRGRVLAHIAFCKECAMIYRKACTLKNAAANPFAIEGWNEYKDTDGAYLAVASDSLADKKEKRCGSFSVEIDGQEGVFRFVDDSFVAKGIANKYAMNLEDDGLTLRDDFDAMVLTIRNGILTLCFEDGSINVHGVLRSIEKMQLLETAGNTCSVALPQNALCILEITLSE